MAVGSCYRNMVSCNEVAGALAAKVVVDGTVMVRDMAYLIRAVTVQLQNKEEAERGIVHIQRMIDVEVTRGEARHCCLAGKAGRTHNQQMIGTLSVENGRWLLKQKLERLLECSQCSYTSSESRINQSWCTIYTDY